MLGSDRAGERAAAWPIERMRRKTGLTWAELLRPTPTRPPIIVPPWREMAPILARGEVAASASRAAIRNRPTNTSASG